MKRKLFIGALLCLFSLGTVYAQGVNVQINGSHSFVLNESNGIYFHNDSLTVDGVDFALEEVRVITFSASSGIEEVNEEGLSLVPNPVSDIIKVQGLGSEPQNVTIYSTAGIKLMENKAVDGTIINVGHLPEGVYILRCGNRAAKIIKQL